MKKILLFLVLHQFILLNSSAQSTFPYNGIMPKNVTSVAFTHANVVIDYSTQLEDATVIIARGKIVAVGKTLAIPDNAVVYDLQGRFIYPSFVDLYSDYGLPKNDSKESAKANEENPTGIYGAAGWNPAIKAEYDASKTFFIQPGVAKEYRQLGFGVVHGMDLFLPVLVI